MAAPTSNLLSLVIDAYTKHDRSAFIFRDITPLYNAILSPAGYDALGIGASFNPANVNLSTINVEVSYIVSGSWTIGGIINIPLGVPSIPHIITGQGFILHEISASSVNLGSSIPDGVYKFHYYFESDSGIRYEATKYIASTENIKCCLDNKLAAIKFCPTCELSKELLALRLARIMLDQVQVKLDCLDYTGAQEIIDYLSDFCDIKTCGGC